MSIDLSRDPNSATSAFVRVSPILNSLKPLAMTEEDKIEIANTLIFNELKANWLNGNSLSKDYITRVMTTIENKSTLDDIIKDIERRIEKGKNYNR